MTEPDMIDVYHGQNENTIKATGLDINWAAVAQKNPTIKVLAAKATEGLNFLDPKFKYNRAGGAYFQNFGMYHWMYSSFVANLTAQARHFLSNIHPVRIGEFVFLDCEPTKGKPNPTAKDANALANMIEQEVQRDCCMYFGYGFSDFFMNMDVVLDRGRRPWFLPAYGKNTGQIVAGYEAQTMNRVRPWRPTVWQYGSQLYPVKEISGDVDLDKVYDWSALRRASAMIPRTYTKDTDMAKVIRVQEADGRKDNAVFSVSGQCAVWVSTGPEFDKLFQLGFVPTNDVEQVEFVNREDLNVLILVSAAPEYASDYSGPRTVAEDFRAST